MEEGTPSATARAVAQVRATMDRPVTPTGDGLVEQRLVEGFAASGRSAMAAALERRTRWFDGVTLRLIEAGIRQVVIVAAGYDCRALRFRTPGVQFIELDHPATQADKRAILDDLGADTDDSALAAADFTIDDVDTALAGAGHDESQATRQSAGFQARVASVGEQARSSYDEAGALDLLHRCGWDGDTSRPVVLATPI